MYKLDYKLSYNILGCCRFKRRNSRNLLKGSSTLVVRWGEQLGDNRPTSNPVKSKEPLTVRESSKDVNKEENRPQKKVAIVVIKIVRFAISSINRLQNDFQPR